MIFDAFLLALATLLGAAGAAAICFAAIEFISAKIERWRGLA